MPDINAADSLHAFRYGLDKLVRSGQPIAPSYIRDLLDKVMGEHVPPCDSAEQHQRAVQAEEQRDGAYRERACLLAWLATLCPAVIAPAPDVDEPGWEILYLTPAEQQMTWHIAPADVELFEHVGRAPADDPRVQWDGHTTAEKYERIRSLATTPSKES